MLARRSTARRGARTPRYWLRAAGGVVACDEVRLRINAGSAVDCTQVRQHTTVLADSAGERQAYTIRERRDRRIQEGTQSPSETNVAGHPGWVEGTSQSSCARASGQPDGHIRIALLPPYAPGMNPVGYLSAVGLAQTACLGQLLFQCSPVCRHSHCQAIILTCSGDFPTMRW